MVIFARAPAPFLFCRIARLESMFNEGINAWADTRPQELYAELQDEIGWWQTFLHLFAGRWVLDPGGWWFSGLGVRLVRAGLTRAVVRDKSISEPILESLAL
jgi:hypothetical protein